MYKALEEHLEALTRSFVEIDEQLSTRAPGQKKYRYEYGMNKIAEPWQMKTNIAETVTEKNGNAL